LKGGQCCQIIIITILKCGENKLYNNNLGSLFLKKLLLQVKHFTQQKAIAWGCCNEQIKNKNVRNRVFFWVGYQLPTKLLKLFLLKLL
jgi:hypothetical protein